MDLKNTKLFEVLKNAISFNSVLDEKVENGPFGLENKKCLEYVLDQANKMGFETFNRNGYYGYAQTKTNFKETLAIIGHLDIVPANNDGWLSTSPFSLEVINNRLYGRGIVDDKGPILACLFALDELLKSGLKQNKNVKIVFGCAEETTSECMAKYRECEKSPDIAFTPDANFPCIYAEKAILFLKLRIKNIDGIDDIYGGTASNIVLDKITVKENGKEKVFLGKAAHASTPEKGENAFINFLKTRNDKYSKTLLSKLEDVNGKGLGIYYDCPLTGKLTMCIGIIKKEGNDLIINLDLRVPMNVDLDNLTKSISNQLNADIELIHKNPALFMDPDSFLVKTLVNSYNKVNNSNDKAIYSGGGTYAKHIDNCVAFGPQLENSHCSIHENNESITLEHFELMYNVYKEAIKNLAF